MKLVQGTENHYYHKTLVQQVADAESALKMLIKGCIRANEDQQTMDKLSALIPLFERIRIMIPSNDYKEIPNRIES